jgi:hypothetical protein
MGAHYILLGFFVQDYHGFPWHIGGRAIVKRKLENTNILYFVNRYVCE